MSSAKQDDLVEKLLKGALSPEEIKALEKEFDKLQRFDFKPLLRRIFDLNEGPVQNKSNADVGWFGRLNRYGRNKKNRKFFRALRHQRQKKLIVAEGDSWFEYPLFIKDIVDWILKLDSEKYSVYSIASAGDWMGNILYSGTYISELSIYRPDVFLISGGGNDLVGDNRIAILVHKRTDVSTDLDDGDDILTGALKNEGESDANAKRIVIGSKFLNKDFWALLNVFRFQYYIMFRSIRSTSKFDHMKIITQGYDYPIPSSNRSIFTNPLRFFMGNGKWLDIPLNIRGIFDQEEKNCILAAMIYEFNRMIIDVGSKFDKVFHIDCRGVADESCWFDELHLRSAYYKIIAKKYIECIDADLSHGRIFKVCRKA